MCIARKQRTTSKYKETATVALLVEWLLPIPEILGSNPFVASGALFHLFKQIEKKKRMDWSTKNSARKPLSSDSMHVRFAPRRHYLATLAVAGGAGILAHCGFFSP